MLETQKLEDGQVDSRVETETTLVRTEGRVELDSVTSVDGNGSVITFPGDSELDDSLWDLNDGEGSSVFWLLLQKLKKVSTSSHHRCNQSTHRLEGRGNLVEGLLEFGLRGEVGHCAVEC